MRRFHYFIHGSRHYHQIRLSASERVCRGRQRENAPAEKLDVEQDGRNEDTVEHREERAEIRAPPEEERRHTTRRKLSNHSVSVKPLA